MRIDQETQDIWHFIGAFHLATEEAKQRKDYDAFRAQKAEEKAGEILLLDRPFAAPHSIPAFVPGVAADPPGAGFTSQVQTHAPERAFRPEPLPEGELLAEELPPTEAAFRGQSRTTFEPEPPGFELIPPPAQPFDLTLMAPSSLALVGEQLNRLLDNDVLIQADLGVSFLDVAGLETQLQNLVAWAQSLDPIGPVSHPESVAGAKQIAHEIFDAIGTATATPAPSGATVLRGEETAGVHVNGVAVDDGLPVLADHLPELPEGLVIASGPDWVERLVEDEAPEAGHLAITGGNTLVNEVIVTASWIDAPVMLVMGSALRADVVVQINVLSESMQAPNAVVTDSTLINAAQIKTTSQPAQGHPGVKSDTYPSHWVITTLDADLVQLNWFQQQNYILDNDILSVSWSGASTFLRLGENSLSNFASLLEIGFNYDLIVIGGDMINMTMIRQMNVLLDKDWVATDGGAATILGGNNLLFNSAAINTRGVDNMVAMDASHAGLADAVIGGTSGLIEMPMGSFDFAGMGLLKVLHITGDLLTMNLIQQTNVLGDSDQVAAAMSEAEIAQGAEVTLITGSNALANVAQVDTIGIDSTIHVAGEIYTDALLYQANFIDADSPDPYAANGPAQLSSEAVVFLADDMLPEADKTQPGGNDPGLGDGYLDGVNVVLA